MPLTPEQIARIRQKEAATPAGLKRDASTNYREGWFFVTLNTRDGVPVLSTCEGDPCLADGEAGTPHCRYSAVGERVKEVWHSIPSFHSGAAVDAFEAMPEHIHGLLYLKPGNREHLGQIIKGFMIGCSHAYWDTLGIDWRKGHPTGALPSQIKGIATPQYVDRDHTCSLRGPALFVHGYNDTEPLAPEQVETKRAYIHDQARKRLLQGDRHECFRKYRRQHSHNWTEERLFAAVRADWTLARDPDQCRQALLNIRERLNYDASAPVLDFVGDRRLLSAARRLPLVCHRADSALADWQLEAALSAAREGAVIVSAFVSPRERLLKERLLDELLPVVEILDNGLADRHKPSGRAFYAMAENRLLQITPWSYRYQREDSLSREQCMVMNELARVICGTPDDWWKG